MQRLEGVTLQAAWREKGWHSPPFQVPEGWPVSVCLHQYISPGLTPSGLATLLLNKKVNFLREAREAAIVPASEWQSRDPC